MLPKHKEITSRTLILVHEIEAFAATEFGLPNMGTEVVFNGRGNRSRGGHKGGKPFISLKCAKLTTTPVAAWVEYASYNRYLEIGGFKTDDWRLYLDALVCHEMAHAIQLQLILKAMRDGAPRRMSRGLKSGAGYSTKWGYTEGGHGPFFQNIYRILRNRFVNDRVPNSAYVNPQNKFEDGLEEGEKAVEMANHPLAGTQIAVGGKRFEILGRETGTRSKYAYRGKCLRTGTVYGLTLYDISRTPAAHDIIQRNPALVAELAEAKRKAVVAAQAAAARRAAKRFGFYS